jgi:metal-sulfur cluster biosynthetic enzyme
MTVDIGRLVRERLADVLDPCSVGAENPIDVVGMGLVDDVRLEDGELTIQMCLTSPQCLMLEHFAVEARRVTADLPGVRTVTVRGDNGMEWTPDRMSAAARDRRRRHLLRLSAVPVGTRRSATSGGRRRT